MLDAERHLAFVAVESEHNGFHFVAYLQEVLSGTKVLAPAHFTHVDETFYTRSNLNECAVVSHDNHLTLHLVANLEFSVEGIPRMRSELFETESDALLLFVKVENNDVELLVEFHNFMRIVHAAPRKVCDVNETIHATEVDEDTVGSDVLDSTLEHLSFFEFGNDFLLLSLEFCFDECFVRNHHVFVFLIDFDNLELHGLSNEDVIVANGLHVNLRTGEEGFNTEDIDNHATLGAALDVTGDDFLVFESCIDTLPRLGGASLAVREHELTAFVLLVFNVNLHHVTGFEVGIVAELVDGDDTVALVANVDHYFAFTNSDDSAFNDFVLVHATEGLVVGLFLFFLTAGCLHGTVFVSIPVKICQGSNVF